MYKLGLIGYPIQHSLSPWIHERLLQKAQLQGEYRLFEITPEDDFEQKVMELKEKELDGFNVTVPYKEKIIPFLDELDDIAKEMQAVNTVVRVDERWIGYNTDGIGYVRSLESAYPTFFEQLDRKVMILGAGGASRGIYYALTKFGVTQIDIANRTKEKAEDIAKLGKDKSKTNIFTIEEASKVLKEYDLIIQTTSMGMKSVDLKPIVQLKQLKSGAIMSDIVYQPIKTQILQDAERLGARILLGHTMLLYQAQYAFEIWTGKRPEVIEMEHELLAVLEGR
ncbi:shikimate dehydrogenase [Oceanobacillus alkalisoli]|uniref:shikimate dehydrogenase n=1 Tax=Oceanobacillus alkalisoli TaxID=2925113 RepID=UPI001EF14027|nr:shikimate dehydrogenase [Oceanobacillus alkalisoli]MCF3941833.1 shikimate dehydrogenase [Oceanobacillus alkalisoli]MCG5103113.1 shikimate dehydrogenase [Oceanobacillus alkalisoli]